MLWWQALSWRRTVVADSSAQLDVAAHLLVRLLLRSPPHTTTTAVYWVPVRLRKPQHAGSILVEHTSLRSKVTHTEHHALPQGKNEITSTTTDNGALAGEVICLGTAQARQGATSDTSRAGFTGVHTNTIQDAATFRQCQGAIDVPM